MSKKFDDWYRVISIGLIVLALAAGGYFLFGGEDLSLNQKENARLIGASYMTMNNEFYKIMSEEITHRVEAEGDQMMLRDPALDLNRQIEQIDEMLDAGIDVLILTPVKEDGLSRVLRRAKEQGVLVIVLDTDVSEPELADCTITSDNYQAGVLVGEYFLSRNKAADIVVMTHETARSGQERVQGFLDTVLQEPDMNIVEKIECEGQLEIAMPMMESAIKEGLSFDSVFCLNDLTSVGVAAALDESGMTGSVQLYGVDASPDAKALIQEGMMEASTAQFPTEIGRMAAEVIYQLLDGEEVEKKILVPVKLITQDNVVEFGVDRWQ